MGISFLDWEDKQLVQIALEFENEGIRVTWAYVARRMARSKRTASQLRLWIISLKRTYGKQLKNFPRYFFSGSAPGRRLLSSRGCPPVSTTRRSRQVAAAMDHTAAAVAEAMTSAVAEPSVGTPTQVLPAAAMEKIVEAAALLERHDVTRVLASIFSEITANDIRQVAGRTHNNAGELLPSGVHKMLDSMQPLDERDVFLDIGAGIGNILAQVALTTKVRRCIGIEVKNKLCTLATRCIGQYTAVYPLLRKVTMKAADIRDVPLSHQAPVSDATVVYANFFLFEEAAKLVVARELSALPKSSLHCIYFSLLSETQNEVHTAILRSLELGARAKGRM